MAKHNILGEKGEEEASNYLVKNGYKILEQNWTHSTERYEIDIIAQNDEYIVFVEVKSRDSKFWGNPEDFVSSTQMKRIIETAHEYLIQKNINLDTRFDVIAINFNSNNKLELEHIEDAFYPSI